jgi:hypothetical protein
MPDWRQIVSHKLVECGLATGRDDVIAELAGHLEERYEQARSEGLADEAAAEVALQEVRDWPGLAEGIRRTRPQEDIMKRSTKILLTAMGLLWLTGVALVLMHRTEWWQSLIWIALMAMLVSVAVLERDRLNQRTQAFWFPGFANLGAAMVLLFSANMVFNPFPLFQDLVLHPQNLFARGAASQRAFYFAWLTAQVALGAFGAQLSRRAGGCRATRILAGVFPTMVLFDTYIMLAPVDFWIMGRGLTCPFPKYLVSALLVWVAAPVTAVVMGAMMTGSLLLARETQTSRC